MISRFRPIISPMLALIAISCLTLNTHAQLQIGQDINGEAAYDYSGKSVSMPDAYTVAIGATENDGSIGWGGGHVRVYAWNGTSWSQKGADINGEAYTDGSGGSVSMPDANTVAIGAWGNDDNGTNAGNVRIFAWSGTAWVQKGIDIDGDAAGDDSGFSVSMPDNNTVAIGDVGNQAGAGHTRIYEWNGVAWLQKGLDINGEANGDVSGFSVSMPDANTVAIGAYQNDGAGIWAGHARIYEWNGTVWVQKGIDIDGESAYDWSGSSVSMPDANTIAIGAHRNEGNGYNAGHVRVYSWNGTSWSQKGNDIDGESNYDNSGWSVSMPDANNIAISAYENDGNGQNAGHVRIFGWDGTTWVQRGIDIDGETAGDWSGISVSMPDANTVAIGAIFSDGNGTNAGQVRVFDLCPTIEIDIINVCDSHTWIDGNTYTSSTNSPTWTLTNSAGCDSIIILNLTINNSTGVDIQTACNSFKWIDDITYTSNTTTPTWTFTNVLGCDSVVTLNLTINNTTFGIDIQTACDSYLWIDGNTYMTSNNTATHTLTNAAGCDSIVTLNLTINNLPDVTTTQSGTTLTANNTAASYVWLDCDDNFAPISGETAQSFTPTENGNYAVELTENGCVDTSACIVVATNDIIENTMNGNFVLFPNPTSDEVKIVFDNVQKELNLSIFSITGQLLEQQTFKNSFEIIVDLKGSAGIYLLKLNNKNEEVTIRVAKE